MCTRNQLTIALPFLAIVAFFCLCNNDGKKKEVKGLSLAVTAGQNDMVLVPGGYFWMGSDEGEVDEKPVRHVWVDSFFIDRFPVTNAAYGVYLRESGHEKPLYWNDEKCDAPGQPVVGITWAEADAYCEWRSQKEHVRITLPTEAQWEKAARGDDKRKYPWGNQPPDKKRATTEITEKMPCVGVCELGRSPYGASDLVGSVWNWCSDWYDKNYYANAAQRNPAGPQNGVRRVVRGGNWVFLGCCSGTPAYALRTSRRNSFHPAIQKKSIGFRCVKTVTAQPTSVKQDSPEATTDAH